ncbi:hypothetical protein BD769DRAFT_1351083, partial [Suillus cothurnatus]
MWIGPIPHELAVLTLPEELLISRHFPRCYIFKLYPKDSRHVNPNHLQQGMAGNVTLYDMNINDVTKMVEGQFLPQPVASLASVLAITYVGTRHLPKDWLKSTFRVRRDVVFNALTWLKAHNPLYADIQISEVQLAHLPEDDVPQEIVSVIRHEASDDVAIRENEGYVPTDNEVRNGVTLPLNELMKHALMNLDEVSDKEGGYVVRHSHYPVSDFGRNQSGEDRKNPLAATYPKLFPYGVGGIEDTRGKSVGFDEHVRWALQY